MIYHTRGEHANHYTACKTQFIISGTDHLFHGEDFIPFEMQTYIIMYILIWLF